MKPIKSSAEILAFAFTTLLVHQAALGQTFPNKPIRIVTSNAGGGSDFTARLIAPELTNRMGQPIVVDNRTAGMVLGETVAKAPADGYTLLLGANSLWLQPFMVEKMPFDPVKDFSPVIYTNRGPYILVVNPAVAVNSVEDLIALAKAKPGTIAFASSAPGSGAQIAVELLKSMTGINVLEVPYKGIAPANTAVLSGEVQALFTTIPSVLGQVKAGKLKALAITSQQPSALFPSLPTVTTALPGYETVVITGILAPVKTPKAVIEKLNAEIGRILSASAVQERFLQVGTEVVGGTPEQFGSAIRNDMALLGKVIKDAGIRSE